MNEKLKERNLKNTLRKGAINNGNEVLRQGPSMRDIQCVVCPLPLSTPYFNHVGSPLIIKNIHVQCKKNGSDLTK
jgi:hypothetical protein